MNPIQKQQQKELEKIEICIDILKNARNELYLSMRFFDVILSGLNFCRTRRFPVWGRMDLRFTFIQTI